jgi:hypothetical protein
MEIVYSVFGEWEVSRPLEESTWDFGEEEEE